MAAIAKMIKRVAELEAEVKRLLAANRKLREKLRDQQQGEG